VFATLECLTKRKQDGQGDAWRDEATNKGGRFSEWYNQLVLKAQLATMRRRAAA
jgi:hypothetical protein